LSAAGEEVSLQAVHVPSAALDMVSVHEEAASAAYAHIFADPFPHADACARWSTHRGPAVLAVAGGATVGFAVAEHHMLEALYVLPSHAGRGIGSALLAAVGPVNRLWVLEQNTQARAYERRHWRWSGESRAGLDTGGITELRYVLD